MDAPSPQLDTPKPTAVQTPLFIVINAGSGSQDADDTVDALARIFTGAGRTHTFVSPRDRETITDAARRAVGSARRCDGVVVAAGGDGTINAVAQVVLGSGCNFGVIPLGTFNLFARTHGIPLEPAAAAQVLLEHPAQPVQAGRVNDLVFLVNASLGLYSELLEDREELKAQLGRSRWVAAGSGLLSLFGRNNQEDVGWSTSLRPSAEPTQSQLAGFVNDFVPMEPDPEPTAKELARRVSASFWHDGQNLPVAAGW